MKASLNVGIVGHVDAGKTTLTETIASLASTNAFDKHARKDGRHNSIDLGFSSLVVEDRRLALIDCPGHSSLIRSVLAASSVFDIAIVVIDACRGIEPQTAEHLLLVSFFCPKNIIIVLNKADLVEETQLTTTKRNVQKALRIFGLNEKPTMIVCSLLKNPTSAAEEIRAALAKQIFEPSRDIVSPLLIAVDHCFAIKGKGTVLTGTILQGCIKMGTELHIPALQETCRIKELQSWKTKVSEALAGERVAALVASTFDAAGVQRVLIGVPGVLKPIKRVIATFSPISFFTRSVSNGCKLHISSSFDVVMADCQFLQPTPDGHEVLDEAAPSCVVLLEFAKPIFAKSDAFYIASKLDHQGGKGCRFAFSGHFTDVAADDKSLCKFSVKIRRGVVERVENDRSIICKGLFQKETKFSLFEKMKVTLRTGEVGVIEQSFGKGGKARITFPEKLLPETIQQITDNKTPVEVILRMRKYLLDKKLVAYL